MIRIKRKHSLPLSGGVGGGNFFNIIHSPVLYHLMIHIKRNCVLFCNNDLTPTPLPRRGANNKQPKKIMGIGLLFPEYMDLTKPCVLCRYYCRSHSVRETMRRVEEERKRGDIVEYEYGQKYCTYQKSYVFFNWNCPGHDPWDV